MGIIIGKIVTVQLSAKLQQMITETKKRRKYLAEYIMAELLHKNMDNDRKEGEQPSFCC